MGFTVLLCVKPVKIPIASSIQEDKAFVLPLIIEPFEYILSAGPYIFFHEAQIWKGRQEEKGEVWGEC